MFNENISDLKNIIPSIAILRLSDMIKDIYKNTNKQNLLNGVELQKLYINYGDKYTAIDKAIMLIYGITRIDNYKIDEEIINIDRVNILSLNETEKELYDKGKLNKVATHKLILSTNVGDVVIGYDYAYVRKETYTPNIELTPEQETILNDERLIFDLNYPYIKIDPYKQLIYIHPVITYKIFTKEEEPKHNTETYIIDVNEYKFIKIYSKQPLKETDEIINNEKDNFLKVEGWSYDKTFIKRGKQIKKVIQYKNNSNILQFITNQDYSITTISFNDTYKEYIAEKTYFINYSEEEQNANL